MSFKKPGYLKYIIAFLICIFYFLFHFHYMQQFLHWDQVWYITNIYRVTKQGGYVYFNPHHLHIEIGGVLFNNLMINLFETYGFTDLVFNMRLRSLVTACVGIFFLFLFLVETIDKYLLSLAGTLLGVFCCGFMAYSTQVDTGIFPLTGLLATIWVVNKIQKAKKNFVIYSVLAGIILFFDVMFHQYMVIVCVCVFISIIIPPGIFFSKPGFSPFIKMKYKHQAQIDKQPVFRYCSVLILTVVAAGLIIGTYFYIGRIYYRLPVEKEEPAGLKPYNSLSFQEWLLWYTTGGETCWGNGLRDFNAKHGLWGLTNAFVSHTGPKYIRHLDLNQNNEILFEYRIRNFLDEKGFVYNLVAVLCLFVLLGFFLFFIKLWRKYKRIFLFIILCLILLSLFTIFWEPLYYEFWLNSCALLCIIFVLIINMFLDSIKQPVSRVFNVIAVGLVMYLVLGIACHNILYYQIPYSQQRHHEECEGTIWPGELYKDYFSTYIYKYPEDPYKTVKPSVMVR